MSDPTWSRAETGRLHRGPSTSLLPTLAWHPIPGMVEHFSPFPVRDIDSTLATVQSTDFATSEEELQAAIDLQNSEADKPDIDFKFCSETHPHHPVVAATRTSCLNDIDFLHGTNMAHHIKMDTYSGELGIEQQKFIDECHA